MSPTQTGQAQLHVRIDETDPRYVFVNGRRLARVIGAEGPAGGAPAAATPPAGEGGEPASGEGGQGGLGDLYDLSQAPEELRPYLEQELQKIVGNVGRRFEEAADFRKQWEPFDKVEGLRDVPVEELQELVEFREVFSDEEKFEDWWTQVGEKLGFFEGAEGEEEGEESPEGETPAWAQTLMERLDALEGTVKPISESVSQQEARARQDAAQAAIDTTLDALEGEHGEFDRNAVATLAIPFSDDPIEEAIKKGFAQYQQIAGKAQGELADSKNGQPNPAKPGGQPDTSPQQFTDLNDPRLKAAARQRLAGAGVR